MLVACASLLQFCGPTVSKTVTKASYNEDLSIYRKQYDTKEAKEKPNKNSDTKTQTVAKPNVVPVYHIRQELDSVQRIMIAQGQQVRYLDGYTVQIYSGNNRDMANQYKSQAYDLVEDVLPRVSYVQPNYKVKLGEYVDRLEANAHYTIVKSKFPRAVLIPHKINIDDYISRQ